VRQVEDQPLPSRPGHHLLDLMADGVDVPVGDQALARVEGLECPVGKRTEMGPVEGVG
jgi:hypothetical protein